MATRGKKPKSPHLHVVENTARKARHGDIGENLPGLRDGELDKPDYLRGRQSELWDEVSPLLWWLQHEDAYKLGLWCCLQAEFEHCPDKMVAARIGQLRALGSELGMDGASRTRMGLDGAQKSKAKDPFFDD